MSDTFPLDIIHKVTARKLRLFACAYAGLNSAADEILVAERYADGAATEEELEESQAKAEEFSRGWGGCLTHSYSDSAYFYCHIADVVIVANSSNIVQFLTHQQFPDREDLTPDREKLISCIFGDLHWPHSINPMWMVWNEGIIPRLAQQIYDRRKGWADFDRVLLGVLADALEDAGCDERLIDHCRQPGPHVRGCWVIDLLLGKQ